MPTKSLTRGNCSAEGVPRAACPRVRDADAAGRGCVGKTAGARSASSLVHPSRPKQGHGRSGMGCTRPPCQPRSGHIQATLSLHKAHFLNVTHITRYT